MQTVAPLPFTLTRPILDKLGCTESPLHDIEVTSITADSRKVITDGIFVALKGKKEDGTNFIPQALQAGASCIVLDSVTALAQQLPQGVTRIVHPEPRLLLAMLARLFFPKQPDTIVAITGTNGKSSIVHFCNQLWERLGITGACLGTLGLSQGSKLLEAGTLTTPDAVSLQQLVSSCASQGITHIALEASSHGLDQYRLHGLTITRGGFTNLTRDHLDYHGSMEEYRAAKFRLFSEVLPGGSHAVMNADSDECELLATIAKEFGHHVLRYGSHPKADLRIIDAVQSGLQQHLSLSYQGKVYELTIPMLGRFQISNILCAIGLMLPDVERIEDLLTCVETLTPAPGRLEHVISGSKTDERFVFVDYAHTPDALEQTLHELRHITKGSLHVVFGCGGNRDKGKRPLMGQVACQLADHVIITDDNPRHENPEEIRNEIKRGCTKSVSTIGDRKEAIHSAIAALRAGDVLLIAGKGHEKTQIIGNEQLPCDDVTIAYEGLMLSGGGS